MRQDAHVASADRWHHVAVIVTIRMICGWNAEKYSTVEHTIRRQRLIISCFPGLCEHLVDFLVR
jgi:hypothetical protein